MSKASFFTKPLAAAMAALTVLMPCSISKASANKSNNFQVNVSVPNAMASAESSSNTVYTKSVYSELFKTPNEDYRWVAINHDLSAYVSNIGNHAQGWKDNGMGGTVTQIWAGSANGYDSNYLNSDNNFSILNQLSEGILGKGQKIWLYDEIGYPSGTAYNTVFKTDSNADGIINSSDDFDADLVDKYAAQGIVEIRVEGNGNSSVSRSLSSYNDSYEQQIKRFLHAYAIDSDGILHSATVTDNNVSFNGVSGSWTLYIFAIKEFFEGTEAATNSSDYPINHYINIMDANAVKLFIDSTYQKYKENYTYFGNVTAIFTDEPSLMEKYQSAGGKTFNYAQLSWAEGFEELFKEMHGYSILDNLHHMFSGNSDEAKIVRVNYRQTVAKMVSENYFKQISDFCPENTLLTGHALLEENIARHVLYYGDLMQSLRQMDMPGVDTLYGDPDVYLHGTVSDPNPVFMAVKYATSAETLVGKNRMTMAEFAPTENVFKNDVADGLLTSENKNKLLKTLNLLQFHGVTNIVSYFAIEYFGETTAQRKEVTDYLARLSYMSRQSKWDGDIGLYYPINSQQAVSTPSKNEENQTYEDFKYINTVAEAIYENNMDFTIVDNQFIMEATVEDGVIYNGNVSFKAICMPAVDVIPLEVLQKLNAFEASGGKVYWIKTAPTLPDSKNDIAAFNELKFDISVVSLENAMTDLKSACSYGISTDYDNVYVGKYKLNDATMFWVYNYNGDSIGGQNNNVLVCLPKTLGAVSYDIYDPATGTVETVAAHEIADTYVSIPGNTAKLIVINNVETTEYVQLDGKTVYLVRYNVPKDENTTYVYNNEELYWSNTYNAYCTLVVTEEDTAPEFTIVSKEGTPKVLEEGVTDVNGSGLTDLNDAQFVWNMYNRAYDKIRGNVTVEKLLIADVNGDKIIDPQDSVAIVDSIPEEQPEQQE